MAGLSPPTRASNMAAAPTCCQPAGAPFAPPLAGVATARFRRVAAGRLADWPGGGGGPAHSAHFGRPGSVGRPGVGGGPAPWERGQFPASRGGCSGAGGVCGARLCVRPRCPPALRALLRGHGAAVRGSRPPCAPRRARPAAAGGPAGAAEPAEPGGALQPQRLLLPLRAAGDQALHAEDAGFLDAGGTGLPAASAPCPATAAFPRLQTCALLLLLRREKRGAGAGGPCAGLQGTVQGTGKS